MTMTTSGLDAHRDKPAPAKRPKRAERKTFSAEFKLMVIRECEEAGHGQVGVVLRKHGVNRTHLRDWRKQYHEGGMAALAGRAGARSDANSRQISELATENAQLKTDVEKFKTLVAISGKAYALLELLSDGAD